MIIRFCDVTLRYPYEEWDLLKSVSFTLTEGVNTVLCDVQSGKTSLCRLLCKQIKPTFGSITVDGLDISSISNEHLGILYLPSKSAFFYNRSVRYNIEYPLAVRKTDKKSRANKANEVAAALQIGDLSAKMRTLSASERNSVALARGLTVSRRAVIFDDFFNAEILTPDGTARPACALGYVNGNTDGNACRLVAADEIFAMFGGATIVNVTSDVRQAAGNTVVLDGGSVAYCGDSAGAVQCVSKLNWLVNQFGS